MADISDIMASLISPAWYDTNGKVPAMNYCDVTQARRGATRHIIMRYTASAATDSLVKTDLRGFWYKNSSHLYNGGAAHILYYWLWTQEYKNSPDARED